MPPIERDPSELTCGEPLIYPVNIDMSANAPREFLPAGRYPFSIFFSTVPAGAGQVELNINGQWVPINLGEAFDFGHFATSRIILIRQTNAVAGFAQFIIGGTPETVVER